MGRSGILFTLTYPPSLTQGISVVHRLIPSNPYYQSVQRDHYRQHTKVIKAFLHEKRVDHHSDVVVILPLN